MGDGKWKKKRREGDKIKWEKEWIRNRVKKMRGIEEDSGRMWKKGGKIAKREE